MPPRPPSAFAGANDFCRQQKCVLEFFLRGRLQSPAAPLCLLSHQCSAPPPSPFPLALPRGGSFRIVLSPPPRLPNSQPQRLQSKAAAHGIPGNHWNWGVADPPPLPTAFVTAKKPPLKCSTATAFLTAAVQLLQNGFSLSYPCQPLLRPAKSRLLPFNCLTVVSNPTSANRFCNRQKAAS